MITVICKEIQDYDCSFHTEYTVTADYSFEKDIIEKCLSQAIEESKIQLRKRTKGE